jgi:glycosyltransferase involved in cell wall biosynthesis
MNILWLAQNRPDNISIGRQILADYLRQRGYNVTITSTTPKAVATATTRLHNYDLIIGTTRAGAIAGMVLKQLGNLPLVVDNIDPMRQFEEQSPLLAPPVRVFENRALRIADHVLYVYPEEEDRIKSHASSYSHTDFGVEYDMFANPDPASIQRASSRFEALDLNENVAIYVGGLDPIYHIEEMVESMKYLDDWNLVIIGTGTLTEFTRDSAERMGNVEFLGTVPHEDVPGYLHLADVGLCLVDDARTLKVLEYMAAGLPVVQLDGEARERFGNVVEFSSTESDEIAASIRRSQELANEDELREFTKEFSWASIAEDYADALYRILG